MQKTERTERQDVYTRITGQIVADLEKGVRPWVKPWNAEHAAGRITRPLRHNGQPYCGINITTRAPQLCEGCTVSRSIRIGVRARSE